MRIALAMLLAALSLSPLEAAAGEWQPVLAGYDLRVYSDTVRTSKDADGGKVVEFLATWDTLRPIPNADGGTVNSIKAQTKIFCERRGEGVYGLRGTGFSEAGMQGKVLFADKDLGYQSIEPETMWYELRVKYCAPLWQKLIPARVLRLLD